MPHKLQIKMSLQNEVIEQIISSIGKADAEMIESKIDDLIKQNAEITQNRDGFLYGGTFFSNLPPKETRNIVKYRLDESLFDQGDELVKMCREFSNDTTRLKQGLNVLLRDCTNHQDIRDALPNAVRSVVPELASLERTRPVAYTLQDKPLMLDQWPQTEDLLIYYLSSRMLY